MILNYAVVIPTYDRPIHLYSAIKSVKLQKLSPAEIIVVDNHPDSKNAKIVKNISKKLKIKIKYLIFKKNGGALGARNYGCKKTNCRYIAFLDDDDKWSKNYIYFAIKKIKSERSDMCITEFKVIDKNKKNKFNFYIPKKINFNDLIIWNPGVLCSNIFIKRSVFHKIGCYEINLFGSADKDLLLKIISSGYKYSVLKKRLVQRLIHKNQWSNDNYLSFKASFALYKKYRSRMNLILKLKMIKKILFLALKSFFKIDMQSQNIKIL